MALNGITVSGMASGEEIFNGHYTWDRNEYGADIWHHDTYGADVNISSQEYIGGFMRYESHVMNMPPQYTVGTTAPASGTWADWVDVYAMGAAPTVVVDGGAAGHSLSVFVGNCTRNLPPGAAQSGTTITLSGDASDTAETGVDGIATFTDLADGDYHLAAAQTGYTFKPAAGIDVEMAGEDVWKVNFYAYTVGQSVGGGKRRRDGNGGPDKGSRRHHPRRMLYMDNGRSWS